MRYSVLMAAAVFTVGLSAWAADRGDREAKGSVLPGKKGVCLTLRDPDSAQGRKKGGTWEQNMPRVRKLNASWNYSWGLSYPENQPSDLMFLPMVWGGSSDLPAVLERELRPYVKAGRKPPMVMGFNEPDKRNQSNMTVEAALELWPTLEALGVPLVSPACANALGKRDSSNQGVHGTWMRDFMAEVEKRDLRVDTIGVHWYGGTSARHFKERMRKIYETYGERPLMITEFAPADWRAKSVEKNRHSPAKVLAFMKEVLPWMERQDWIAGYAWFPFPIDRPQGASSALFFPDGTLTACGRFYRSVTPENPDGDQSIKPDPPHHQRD